NVGAYVDAQREDDQEHDERRVDDRDRAEGDDAGRAAEALLPEKKKRFTREVRLRGELRRVGVGSAGEPEPRHRDRGEDEDVASHLEDAPDPRSLGSEHFGDRLWVNRIGVAVNLVAVTAAHGV